MQLSVNLKEKSYDIIIEHGVLNRIGNFADLNRKVLIISDTGAYGVRKYNNETVSAGILSYCSTGRGRKIVSCL